MPLFTKQKNESIDGKRVHFITAMSTFLKNYDYTSFAADVVQKARFVRDVKSQRFLDALVDSAKTRVVVKPAGTPYWRAQLACREEPYVDLVNIPRHSRGL